MTMIRLALAALMTCGLMQVAAGQDAGPQQPSSGTSRIRVFGQNGITVDFYENSACIGGNAKKTRVSGGLGDAFSSFLGRAKNTSIGMAETPNTKRLTERDGMVSKAYFREYQIAGNQPVALSMYFQSGPTGGVRCTNLGGTFTPEAGKDYDIAVNLEPGQCRAMVQEIRTDAQGAVTMTDITTTPASKCD